MLSAVEDCVEQIAEVYGEPIDLSRIPLDDADVFADIQRADTIGDFQIESRAQMQSLLRTKPENLDDLTVQVALVRPGPIQGKAVHPYIDARERLRVDPDYVPPVDHELLREPLRDTHGVVVFQDQVLDVAMALAGFTIGEAEGLRRAMSRKRSEEAIEAFRQRFIEGAARNGVDGETADRVYDKLAAFSGFGFPKSHAAAFGLLAYQSAWLRHHYPAEFLCSLLNAQPMGFYPPSSLVRDAQRRGVEVRPPDVNLSEVHCTWEESAVRMGLKYVKSVGEDDAEAVVAEREARGEFEGVGDLARRLPLDARELEALLRSGACDRFGKRRDLLWELGLVTRPQTVQREHKQLSLELDPTVATPELPRPDRLGADARRLRDDERLDRRAPADAAAPAPAARGAAERPAERGAAPEQGRLRRDGGGAPAAVDRARDRLHAARGRARPGEPDRLAGALRAEPRDRPRRAAPARARPLRAHQGQPQHRRRVAREPRPARAPRLAAAGGGLQPPWSPPLRPPLAARSRPRTRE